MPKIYIKYLKENHKQYKININTSINKNNIQDTINASVDSPSLIPFTWWVSSTDENYKTVSARLIESDRMPAFPLKNTQTRKITAIKTHILAVIVYFSLRSAMLLAVIGDEDDALAYLTSTHQ